MPGAQRLAVTNGYVHRTLLILHAISSRGRAPLRGRYIGLAEGPRLRMGYRFQPVKMLAVSSLQVPSVLADEALRAAMIRNELTRILASPSFRDSKRSREFMSFVVEAKLNGREGALKERTLGVEVFGRDPAYSTSDDSIVRVKATEVRKRLSQYNAQAADQEIRIEMPLGSYIPEFNFAAAPVAREAAAEPDALPAAPKRPTRRIYAALGLLAVLASVATWFWIGRAQSPLDQFWAPMLAKNEPVMICIGYPTVYLLSRRVHERFHQRAGLPPLGPYVIPLQRGDVDVSDIIPVTDQFVGVGDAQAAVQLSSMLRSLHKNAEVRIGNDVSFSDLRRSMTILVGGAFSNRWTQELTGDLRFVVGVENGVKMIKDRANPGVAWKPPSMPPTGKVTEDYAIITRLLQSQSGRVVIAVAGITQYANQAGGELLTNGSYLAKALSKAPKNWRGKNLQFVIKTNVLGAATTPPEVVAQHFW